MRVINRSLLILFFCLSWHLGQAQTLDETKEFIKDRIKVKPLRGYKLDVVYGEELTAYDFELITGEILGDSIQKRSLIIERTLVNNGSPILRILDVFDVKGIRSINLVSLTSSSGGIINTLRISMKEEFLNTTRSPIGGGKFRDKPKRDFVEIALEMSKDELESLKKAFLHLNKSYGGNPIDEKLF